jgi:hypothetical protein
MLPSGPCVIANGPALAVGSKYSTIVPLAGRVGMITLLEPHPVRASTIAAAANFRIVDTPLFIQSYTTKSLRAYPRRTEFPTEGRVRLSRGKMK